MPKLGCGLDGLSWTAVRTLIKNVFLKDRIELTVYPLDGSETAGRSPGSASPTKRPAAEDPTSGSSSPKRPKLDEKSKKKIKTPLLNIFEKKQLTPISKK